MLSNGSSAPAEKYLSSPSSSRAVTTAIKETGSNDSWIYKVMAEIFSHIEKPNPFFAQEPELLQALHHSKAVSLSDLNSDRVVNDFNHVVANLEKNEKLKNFYHEHINDPRDSEAGRHHLETMRTRIERYVNTLFPTLTPDYVMRTLLLFYKKSAIILREKESRQAKKSGMVSPPVSPAAKQVVATPSAAAFQVVASPTSKGGDVVRHRPTSPAPSTASGGSGSASASASSLPLKASGSTTELPNTSIVSTVGMGKSATLSTEKDFDIYYRERLKNIYSLEKNEQWVSVIRKKFIPILVEKQSCAKEQKQEEAKQELEELLSVILLRASKKRANHAKKKTEADLHLDYSEGIKNFIYPLFKDEEAQKYLAYVPSMKLGFAKDELPIQLVKMKKILFFAVCGIAAGDEKLFQFVRNDRLSQPVDMPKSSVGASGDSSQALWNSTQSAPLPTAFGTGTVVQEDDLPAKRTPVTKADRTFTQKINRKLDSVGSAVAGLFSSLTRPKPPRPNSKANPNPPSGASLTLRRSSENQ